MDGITSALSVENYGISSPSNQKIKLSTYISNNNLSVSLLYRREARPMKIFVFMGYLGVALNYEFSTINNLLLISILVGIYLKLLLLVLGTLKTHVLVTKTCVVL